MLPDTPDSTFCFPEDDLLLSQSPETAQCSTEVRHRVSSLPVLPEELLALADSPGQLTEVQTKEVFEHIPLIVLAEDEDALKNVIIRFITINKKGGKSRVAVFNDANMTQNFNAAQQTEQGYLPIITCRNGFMAEAAIEQLKARGMQSGLLLMDNIMPGKNGFSLLEQYRGDIPAGFGRVLQSGTASKDCDINGALQKGVFDTFIPKPFDVSSLCSTYAKTFLLRQWNLQNSLRNTG